MAKSKKPSHRRPGAGKKGKGKVAKRFWTGGSYF